MECAARNEGRAAREFSDRSTTDARGIVRPRHNRKVGRERDELLLAACRGRSDDLAGRANGGIYASPVYSQRMSLSISRSAKFPVLGSDITTSAILTKEFRSHFLS